MRSVDNSKPIIIWLYASAFMVLVMVFVGGLTRLTDSGLSITEWKPITGIIPPLSLSNWEIEFAKYKNSPEFIMLHQNMNLSEFKFIYLLEYFHRLLGRITGIIFLLPMIFFWYKNHFNIRLKQRSVLILLVGLMQGFMGWYMVKSGLYDKPYVSHYRLALHLIFASVIYSMIIWEIIIFQIGYNRFSFSSRKLAIIALIFCYVQIWLGGLVAGLDAGLVYNEFPFMGDSFVPSEIYNKDNLPAIFSDTASVQFIHRMGAYFLSFLILILSYDLYKNRYFKQATYLMVILSLQLCLGIFTLIYFVPISLALLHQLVAFFLLGVLLSCVYYKKG